MIFSFLNKKQETLGKASILLASLTFAGQLLSVIRDRLLAGEFGAGVELDIYYTAFRIPDLIFVFVASFFSVYILTPMISGKRKENGDYDKQEIFNFLNRLSTLFSILVITFCTILFFVYPYIVDIFFSEFVGQQRDLLIYMSRVLLLSPLFLGLSNIFASFNQFNKKFYSFAIAPVLYNLSILFGIIFIVPSLGIVGLVYGVLLGLILHAFLAYIPARSDGFILKPDFKFSFKETFDIFKISMPRTAGLVSKQLVLFFITAMAVSLGEGRVTLFTFSFMIYMVTLSLLGSTVAVASFSETSKIFASGDVKKYIIKVAGSFRYLSFWAFPLSVLFILFNNEIVKIVLGTGKFDAASQYIVAVGVFIFSFSIFFQSLSLFLSTSYFAARRTLKPFLINAFSDAAIIISAFYLKINYVNDEIFRQKINTIFSVSGFDGGVLIIITAFSLFTIMNGILLFIYFGLDFKGFYKEALTAYYKKFLPSVFALFGGYFILDFVRNYFNESLSHVLFYSFMCGVLILFIYIISLEFVGGKEYENIKNKVTSRLKFRK